MHELSIHGFTHFLCLCVLKNSQHSSSKQNREIGVWFFSPLVVVDAGIFTVGVLFLGYHV